MIHEFTADLEYWTDGKFCTLLYLIRNNGNVNLEYLKSTVQFSQ